MMRAKANTNELPLSSIYAQVFTAASWSWDCVSYVASSHRVDGCREEVSTSSGRPCWNIGIPPHLVLTLWSVGLRSCCCRCQPADPFVFARGAANFSRGTMGLQSRVAALMPLPKTAASLQPPASSLLSLALAAPFSICCPFCR